MMTQELVGNEYLILKPEQNLDAAIASELKNYFNGAIQNLTDNVKLDMSNVDYIDSSGIGSVVYLYKKLKCQGLELCIVGVNKQPMELFQLLRIDKIIDVESTD